MDGSIRVCEIGPVSYVGRGGITCRRNRLVDPESWWAFNDVASDCQQLACLPACQPCHYERMGAGTGGPAA